MVVAIAANARAIATLAGFRHGRGEAHALPAALGAQRRLRRCRRAAATGDDADLEASLPNERTLEAMAEELLRSDPEAAARIERVTQAAQRVVELQAEQARLAAAIAEAEADDSSELREKRETLDANGRLAEAEVAAAGLLLRAAQLQAESADAARQQWAYQAGEDAERVESGKAAAVAGAGGALGALPYLLSGAAASPLAAAAGLAVAGVSSVLFGVTYRYAVRGDLANTQLKAGVVAAFGLVRGLAQAGEIVGGADDLAAAAPLAALAMGQAMLTFGFASAALEFGFRQGLVRTFGAAAAEAEAQAMGDTP